MKIRYYKSEQGDLIVASTGTSLIIKVGGTTYMVPDPSDKKALKIREVEMRDDWTPSEIIDVVIQDYQGIGPDFKPPYLIFYCKDTDDTNPNS